MFAMDSEYVSPVVGSPLFDFIVAVFSALFVGITDTLTSTCSITMELVCAAVSAVMAITSYTIYAALHVHVWLVKAILAAMTRLLWLLLPPVFQGARVLLTCAAFPFITWPAAATALLGMTLLLYIIADAAARSAVRAQLIEPARLLVHRTLDTWKEELFIASGRYQKERAKKAEAAAAASPPTPTTSTKKAATPFYILQQQDQQPEVTQPTLSASTSSTSSYYEHLIASEAYEWYTRSGRYAQWASTYRSPAEQFPHARAPPDLSRTPPSKLSPPPPYGPTNILPPDQQHMLWGSDLVQNQLNDLQTALADPAWEARFLDRGMRELTEDLTPSVRDAAIDYWRDQRIRIFMASDAELRMLPEPKRGLASLWNVDVLRNGPLEWLGDLRVGSPLRDEVLQAVTARYNERKGFGGSLFAAPQVATLNGGFQGASSFPEPAHSVVPAPSATPAPAPGALFLQPTSTAWNAPTLPTTTAPQMFSMPQPTATPQTPASKLWTLTPFTPTPAKTATPTNSNG